MLGADYATVKAHGRRLLMSIFMLQDSAVGRAFSIAVDNLPDGPQKKTLQVHRAWTFVPQRHVTLPHVKMASHSLLFRCRVTQSSTQRPCSTHWRQLQSQAPPPASQPRSVERRQ
jgi:hypothetical protein